MTSKEYLSRGYRLNELIKSHREELANLRSMMGSIASPRLDKVGGKPQYSSDSAQTNLVIKCVDLEAEIEREIESMVSVLTEVHASIETVENPDYRLVLRCRYILFLNWEQTAVKMNYSIPQARRIHKAALQKFVIPEKMIRNDQE